VRLDLLKKPGDRLVLVGGRDQLDDIRNCPPPTTQRLPDD
jgi:hypothetical protein